jgi:methyl-accepting chemotaxis protein
MSMRKLTVGSKISLGFGVIVILLLAAGLVSYLGVGNLVTGAKEVIRGNQLQGILAQREVDHLNWANKVSTLMNDAKVSKLEVQLDHTKCGFGEWLYGQGRQAAEALVPSLVPYLKQVEAPHERLHKSAAKIGQTFQQPHPGLGKQLSDIMGAHISWTERVASKLGNEGAGLILVQDRVRTAVQEAMSVIDKLSRDDALGDLAAKQAKAKELLGALRYGAQRKDYIFINDLKGVVVLNPVKPQLEGTDQLGLKDPSGKAFFKVMLDLVKVQDNGFVTYLWPQPGNPKPVPKMSYVALFKPWGWMLGSGVYLDSRNSGLMKRAQDFAAGKPFTLGVQLDPAKCALGKWLTKPEVVRLRKDFPELDQALTALEKPHADLHASGREISTLVEDVQLEAALRHYNQKTLPSVEAVKKHLSTVIAAEESLAQGAAAAAQIFADQTLPALKQVQGLLHKLKDEAKSHIMTDKVLLDTAGNTQFTVALMAAIAVVVGLLLSFLITRSICRVLKRITQNMGQSAEQVAAASYQVSSASQGLADMASGQAANLEETSASLEEMADMTRQNASNADEADGLMKEASQVVTQANRSMDDLKNAMERINQASQETSKIIKTIDEIAFQTNLLALNAAVEAARAGEHGAGFAVVADEVRSLAMRAAEAARNTTGLIEGNIENIKRGSRLVGDTDTAFRQVEESAVKVAELVGEIAAASQEQSKGIGQLNHGATEMDSVCQNVASNAEESAASSEELSGQAEHLNEMVQELSAMVGGASRNNGTGQKALPMNARQEYLPQPEAHRSNGNKPQATPDQMKDNDFMDF